MEGDGEVLVGDPGDDLVAAEGGGGGLDPADGEIDEIGEGGIR